MSKFSPAPRNVGFIITAISLGLILLTLLVMLYNVFVRDAQEEYAVSGGEGVGYDMVVDGKFAPDYYPYPNPGGDGSVARNSEEQKVIRTGSFDITVDDFDDVVANLRKSVKEYGGFVVNIDDNGVGVSRDVYMTVKVPEDSFDSFVDKVKGFASVIKSYSENSSDITRAYQDLTARLDNEKAFEKTLVDLLEKAQKVSEVLEVQRELSQVRQNIEVMESQVKYYDSQIEMSTITIAMTLSSESIDITGEKWQPAGVFREALSSLVDFGKSLGSLVIWAVVFSPVLIVVYFVGRYVSRRVTVK